MQAAMQQLANAYSPEDIGKKGYDFYVDFRCIVQTLERLQPALACINTVFSVAEHDTSAILNRWFASQANRCWRCRRVGSEGDAVAGSHTAAGSGRVVVRLSHARAVCGRTQPSR